jgi:hypothetical protein
LTEASLGALPGLGLGLGGRAGLLFGHLGVDLSASYWPNRAATVAARPAAGGEFRLVTGDARACYAFPIQRLELGPCVGLSLGRMSADGFGVRHPGSGSALWIAPLIGATAALSLLPRLALRLDLAALAPLERPPFVLDSVGDVFGASRGVGRASQGVEGRF